MCDERGRAKGVTDKEAHTFAALRDEGRRITTARRLVIELLARTDEHLTADDLATRIHGAHPEIHLSTVYRTLDSLREWELLEHVRQAHGPSFFHLAGAHRHLVCDDCGRIHDVPAEEFDALVERIRELYAFELRLGQVALVGRCREHGSS
jgi:Fe2+ or Zn2+ uptake regulation protein